MAAIGFCFPGGCNFTKRLSRFSHDAGVGAEQLKRRFVSHLALNRFLNDMREIFDIYVSFLSPGTELPVEFIIRGY